ncbi:hypothetical protein O3P69_014407 [Scylla paramamosain]|uniref:BZIP domain-containing protein n=1 Tax=Scylla paramamosain TaxID=85552 RepID=A0AAW0TBH0_SCYPA
MTTDIINLNSIPNEINNLNSVSECGSKMKSEEMSPVMPQNLSIQRPPTEMNTAKSQGKSRKLYILDDNVDKASCMNGDKTKTPGSPTISPMGKKKIYMMPPMSNPDEEKRRRNAIIAYKNRLLKKKRSQDLQENVKALEETNVQLRGINQQLDKDLRASHEQQRFMSNMIQELQSEIMSLQSLFQTQQEKLAFIQEHLRLISGTIDENDSTRKLLNALLERIPVSSPTLTSPHHITSPPRIISPPYITSSRNVSPRLTTTSPPYVQLPPLAPIPKSSAAS